MYLSIENQLQSPESMRLKRSSGHNAADWPQKIMICKAYNTHFAVFVERLSDLNYIPITLSVENEFYNSNTISCVPITPVASKTMLCTIYIFLCLARESCGAPSTVVHQMQLHITFRIVPPEEEQILEWQTQMAARTDMERTAARYKYPIHPSKPYI